MTTKQSTCAVIPSFNHSAKLADISRVLLAKSIAIIIIDDASTAQHRIKLQQIATSHENIHLVTHSVNQGKGGAVISGLLKAKEMGYSHALQVDADGQHDLRDINTLLSLSAKFPLALISGQPVYDHTIPKGRLWGRSITHFWVYIETLSLQVKDTMCGFRVYPLTATSKLIQQVRLGKRMDFDIEIMVRLFWRNVDVKFVATKVNYPEDGQSHFRALHDNLLISWLHTRLVIGMLMRFPLIVAQRLRIKKIKADIATTGKAEESVVNDDN
jgi:glycosyltransferase involved in cell wall biosynthesis